MQASQQKAKASHSHGKRPNALNLGRCGGQLQLFCARDPAAMLAVDFISAGGIKLSFLGSSNSTLDLIPYGGVVFCAMFPEGQLFCRVGWTVPEARSSWPEPSIRLCGSFAQRFTSSNSNKAQMAIFVVQSTAPNYPLMTHPLLRQRPTPSHSRTPFCQPSYSSLAKLTCSARFFSPSLCCRPTQPVIQSTFF